MDPEDMASTPWDRTLLSVISRAYTRGVLLMIRTPIIRRK